MLFRQFLSRIIAEACHSIESRMEQGIVPWMCQLGSTSTSTGIVYNIETGWQYQEIIDYTIKELQE